jgi:hypothetical protein
MAMVGGFGAEKPADAEVQALFDTAEVSWGARGWWRRAARCAVRTRNMVASGCALVRMRGAQVHALLEVVVWGQCGVCSPRCLLGPR